MSGRHDQLSGLRQRDVDADANDGSDDHTTAVDDHCDAYDHGSSNDCAADEFPSAHQCVCDDGASNNASAIAQLDFSVSTGDLDAVTISCQWFCKCPPAACSRLA